MAAYVVWDWNGTMFDDVALCIQVMNGMLEKRGLPRLAGPEQYRQVFTFPVEEYYKALGQLKKIYDREERRNGRITGRRN